MLYIGFINFFKENARSWPIKEDTSRVSHLMKVQKWGIFTLWTSVTFHHLKINEMFKCACNKKSLLWDNRNIWPGRATSSWCCRQYSAIILFFLFVYILTFILVIYVNFLSKYCTPINYLSEIVLVIYHLFPFLFMSKLYLYINTNNCICCVLAAVIGQIQIMWSHRGSNAC